VRRGETANFYPSSVEDADRECAEQALECEFEQAMASTADTSASEQSATIAAAKQQAPKTARARRKRRGRLDGVDRHPARLEIEALLVRGASLRQLEKRFGIPFYTLHRHLKRLKQTAPETVAAIAAADWKVPPGQEFDSVVLLGLEQGLVPPRIVDNPLLAAAIEQQVLREMYLSVSRARVRIVVALNKGAAPNSIIEAAEAANLIRRGEIT